MCVCVCVVLALQEPPFKKKSFIVGSPNIQTSLAVVKRLKLMDSGAIHLIGKRETEAVSKR